MSEREGEYLFTCTECGEKWQGRITMGYMRLYQTKTPTYQPTARVRTVRLLDKEHDGVVGRWGSIKKALQWASRHNPPRGEE